MNALQYRINNQKNDPCGAVSVYEILIETSEELSDFFHRGIGIFFDRSGLPGPDSVRIRIISLVAVLSAGSFDIRIDQIEMFVQRPDNLVFIRTAKPVDELFVGVEFASVLRIELDFAAHIGDEGIYRISAVSSWLISSFWEALAISS